MSANTDSPIQRYVINSARNRSPAYSAVSKLNPPRHSRATRFQSYSLCAAQ